MKLSQKRTCGRIDWGAGVYGGCLALEERTHRYEHDVCALGFKCSEGKPLEPCLKPTTKKQYDVALKMRNRR